MPSEAPGPTGTFKRADQRAAIENFRFESGARLAKLHIGFWTAGTLNDERDNVVFLCPGASGNRDWALPFCRAGGAFDPACWFIISADLPGGGSSSRLSLDSGFPPSYSITDLANAVLALLDHLGIPRLRAFCGASMASMIGLDVAQRHPDRIAGLALWTAGYRTDGYARSLANAFVTVLGLGTGPAVMRAAVAGFIPALIGRAGVAAMDAGAQGAFIDEIAARWTEQWSQSELAARYRAISCCDLGAGTGGSQALAQRITCPVLLLQASSDPVFPVADTEALAAHMALAEVAVIDTPLGHMAPAAAPGTPEFAFFDSRTTAFLTRLEPVL